jgi:hypothetical protein
MQLAAAILLSLAYSAIALALGALSSSNALYWFLVPIAGVTSCAILIGRFSSRFFPVPWLMRPAFGHAPRRVHLSWRTAVRVPSIFPTLFFPGRMLAIVSTADPAIARRVMAGAAALIAIVLGFLIRQCRREMRLLRDGEMATAIVDGRISTGDDPFDRIQYHFFTAGGVAVFGRTYDKGYNVREGSRIPVFYKAGNPRDHVAACGCWFEAD